MTKTTKTILGIESSCDETAAAVIQVLDGEFRVLSNVVSSQINIHKKYGGVVPEVAARNHVKNILPVIDQALEQAHVTKKEIDQIAVTAGPGLITSLMVGVQTAKTLATVWQKPLVPVNHLNGHLYAPWLEHSNITFPVLGVLVSGGHTELLLLKTPTNVKRIGATIDDAAGEAFDKVAKMLELGYPGGPEISKLAELGNKEVFSFPRPMHNSGNYDFSFSGLKTSVLYTIKKLKKLDHQTKADLAAGFQEAVVDIVSTKALQAAKEYKTRTVLLSGGVAANKALRARLEQKISEAGIDFVVPHMQYCTDNAAMIAAASYFAKPVAVHATTVDPNLSLS